MPPAWAADQQHRSGQRQAGHGTTARRAPGIALDSTPMRLPGASAITAMPRRRRRQEITKRYACALSPVFKQALRPARRWVPGSLGSRPANRSQDSPKRRQPIRRSDRDPGSRPYARTTSKPGKPGRKRLSTSSLPIWVVTAAQRSSALGTQKRQICAFTLVRRNEERWSRPTLIQKRSSPFLWPSGMPPLARITRRDGWLSVSHVSSTRCGPNQQHCASPAASIGSRGPAAAMASPRGTGCGRQSGPVQG
jgi:hypothetical protein